MSLEYLTPLRTVENIQMVPSYRVSRQICMDEEVYKDFTSRLVLRIIEAQTEPEKPWISSKEAMSLLGIKDERTLSKYCQGGRNSGCHDFG